MKIIGLILLIALQSWGAYNYRVLSADSRISDDAGWSLGDISATDTLVWDGSTGFNDTFGVAFKDTCAGIRIENGYNKWLWTKGDGDVNRDTIWVNGPVYINKGAGYINMNTAIVQEGNYNFFVDSCPGGSMSGHLHVVKKGTDTISVG
ncbi:MAG: hypothetical protein ACRC49_10670, partial [Plesiomonas sp.]